MVVRFCSGLGLGHYQARRQDDDWEDIQEDGEPDTAASILDADSVPDVPLDYDDDDEVQSLGEGENVDEILDYGYEDEQESDDEQEEEEDDLGPEDGEEPFNHDMEVLDQEGYGHL